MSSPAENSAENKPTRRDLVKLGAATGMAAASSKLPAAPAFLKIRAATDQVKFGMIGTGSRGSYLLQHLSNIDDGHCAALCDVNSEALDHAADIVRTNPRKYQDYRELLADRDVEAVLIAVPLYVHFPVTRDSLLAGKHTFCEKSLVFRPDEVHALRALAAQHSNQVLQVGLQRRYSLYFESVKKMVDTGVLGDVTHMYAQWHRNPGWTMKPGGKSNPKNWRLFREFSGGLTAELASHHIDVADWYFGASPEFVVGVGGLDTWHDGRNINDNIQLIFNYPRGRKLTFSAISTNQHSPLLGASRPEFGIMVMGTAGAVEINVGSDNAFPTALWYREPVPTKVSPGDMKTATNAGATFALAGPQTGIPIITPETDVNWKNDPFLLRESKLARRWLYTKGIMTPEEERNPVDTELVSFLNDSRTRAKPKADVEVGLADSTAVILSNLALDEGRRVFFKEMETMGTDTNEAMNRQIA